MSLSPMSKILLKLTNAKQINSTSWQARCPAHDDKKASLSVTEKADRVLLYCHAGCKNEDILRIMGLEMKDLFSDNGGKGKRKIKEESCYRDEDGKPLYFSVRFEPKGFAQYRLENGKKVWNIKGCRRVLYRLPETRRAIQAGKTIFIPEGEKDCHCLIRMGLSATTNPMGAGKWRPEYAEQLKGARQVVILPDNDDPGRAHAEQIAASLAGIPDVRIVQVPAHDVTDWMQDGGSREALLGLVERTTPSLAAAGARERTQLGPEAEPGPAPLLRTEESAENLTDLGNARRLVRLHKDDLRFCHPWGKWLVWDGRRWKIDDTSEVERRAKSTVAAMYAEAAGSPDKNIRKAMGVHAMKSESRSKLDAMIALAKSEPGIPILPDQCDTDPWLLNTMTGTLNLKTGEMQPHRQADYITKLCPVEYREDARAPTWSNFLYRIMEGSEDLLRFLRRAVGYSLTGNTSERALFLLYGTGKNGKSTFLETIRAVLGGDYALTTPTQTLMTKRGDSIPNDIARLKGARFVSARETDEGRRFAEAMVKELTGQDTMTARFMRAEFFEFKPEFKIFLATNHKPIVRGTDPAIWDRLKLVPFSVTIPEGEQDKDLAEKLLNELPGVLAWAVAGCEEWLNEGLSVPPEVTDATMGYRDEMDILAGFLGECCVTEPAAEATAKALYAAYVKWSEENGEKPVSQKMFGMRLTERGFDRARSARVRMWKGIGLEADQGGDG